MYWVLLRFTENSDSPDCKTICSYELPTLLKYLLLELEIAIGAATSSLAEA